MWILPSDSGNTSLPPTSQVPSTRSLSPVSLWHCGMSDGQWNARFRKGVRRVNVLPKGDCTRWPPWERRRSKVGWQPLLLRKYLRSSNALVHKWTRILLPNLQFCETGRELSRPSSISPRYIIRLCQTDIHQPQRLEGNPVRTHLKQRTRPSKKLINITDAKRYINTVTIAKDGPPITKRDEPYMPVARIHCGTTSSTKRLIITVLYN